ncbi:unnamed protein product [Ixodes pacificus]
MARDPFSKTWTWALLTTGLKSRAAETCLPSAFVQRILGIGKPSASQSMTALLPFTTDVSEGSMIHCGGTGETKPTVTHRE